MRLLALFAMILCLVPNLVRGAEFKSARECVVGSKVKNRGNESGVVL